MLAVDGRGTPLTAVVFPGQAHESRGLEGTVDAVRIGRRRRPRKLAGDKGFSPPTVRRWLRRRGIRPVIPTKSNERANPRFDRESYRRRNVVERCVGWLKENRRLRTRYEKLATSYLMMVKLAIIRRYLRLLEP